MKTELTGRVELTESEIKDAALAHVLNNKKLSDAIDKYLSSRHNYSTVRVRYHEDKGAVRQAVVDVKTHDKGITKFSDDQKKLRENDGGFRRENLGIFKFLKELFGEAAEKKERVIRFEDLYATVKLEYKKMEKDRLAMYLHDKRMLPNIKFYKRDGNIIINDVEEKQGGGN